LIRFALLPLTNFSLLRERGRNGLSWIVLEMVWKCCCGDRLRCCRATVDSTRCLLAIKIENLGVLTVLSVSVENVDWGDVSSIFFSPLFCCVARLAMRTSLGLVLWTQIAANLFPFFSCFKIRPLSSLDSLCKPRKEFLVNYHLYLRPEITGVVLFFYSTKKLA
jgi:hypothetical protein